MKRKSKEERNGKEKGKQMERNRKENAKKGRQIWLKGGKMERKGTKLRDRKGKKRKAQRIIHTWSLVPRGRDCGSAGRGRSEGGVRPPLRKNAAVLPLALECTSIITLSWNVLQEMELVIMFFFQDNLK